MADPRHHLLRRSHDRPRRDRDEPRAAVGAARAGVHERRPAVDRDRVFAVVREPAAVLRAAGRPDRPQGDLPDRAGRVRGRFRCRRRLGQLHDAGDGARLPGRLRRAAGAVGPVPADHDVHRPEGTGQGVRRLRRGRGQRLGSGAADRRRADLLRVVAVVHVHQPGLRRDRDHRRPAAAGSAAQDAGRPAGHPGRGGGVGRDVLPGLRLLERRDARLARPVDGGLPRGRGRCC